MVDDRVEDGEAVARRLWQDQVPNCFVKYDDDLLENIRNKFACNKQVIVKKFIR